MLENQLNLGISGFATDNYNSLGSLGESHDTLQSMRERDDKILKALRIFVDHGLDQVAGVCLLHRHFGCEEGEAPLEREVKSSDGKLHFVTSPTRLNDDLPEAVASRFRWLPGGKHGHFVSLEFSAVPQVVQAAPRVADNLEFLATYGAYLAANGLQNVLGLSVMHRPQDSAEGRRVFLERTFGPPFRNVIEVIAFRELVTEGLIPAFWGTQSSGCCSIAEVCSDVWCEEGDEGPHLQIGPICTPNGHVGCV